VSRNKKEQNPYPAGLKGHSHGINLTPFALLSPLAVCVCSNENRPEKKSERIFFLEIFGRQTFFSFWLIKKGVKVQAECQNAPRQRIIILLLVAQYQSPYTGVILFFTTTIANNFNLIITNSTARINQST
jgi:hypothetical protein